MTRNLVTGMLYSQILTITFTKKDGSERTIRGTQDPTRIPFFKHPKKISEEVKVDKPSCPIFDLDLDEWRSFNWNSIKTIPELQYNVERDGEIVP